MMIAKRLSIVLLIAATSVVWAEKPKVIEEIHGTVLGVIDGDTVTLHTEQKPLSIRLEGIDAPESAQKHGADSRDALKKLVAGKAITVRKTGVDQYGRILGVVIVDKTDVCAKMVQDGWAWHFKKYSTDEDLAKLETDARTAKRGIWQEERPTAPWDYRAEKKAKKEPAADTAAKPTPSRPATPTPPPVVVPPATDEPASTSGMVWVNGYTRKNGTMVKGYWRRK